MVKKLKFILFTALLFHIINIKAQEKVSSEPIVFVYDVAGNRVLRTLEKKGLTNDKFGTITDNDSIKGLVSIEEKSTNVFVITNKGLDPAKIKKIEVFNWMGNLIMEPPFQNGALIVLCNEPKGIYIVRINYDNNYYYFKLLVK